MKPELLIASKEVLKAGATTLGCASLCLATLTVPSPSRQRDTQHEHYDLSTGSSQQDKDDHFTIVFDNSCGAWIQYKGENDGDFLYQLSTVPTRIKTRFFFFQPAVGEPISQLDRIVSTMRVPPPFRVEVYVVSFHVQ